MKRILEDLARRTEELREAGLFKAERVITSVQGARISVAGGGEVLNFCANNYLGLAGDPRLTEAAHKALDRWGYGLSSVRFICGTQGVHKELEERLSGFLGTDDTILYSSCFDANGGLFEPLLGSDDAIISDALNHASIIDGVRLCKAQRYRYANCDMADLEAQLQAAQGARFRMITSDGVFSMDGAIAPLDRLTALAEQYGALVHIDECHATGFLGPTGRGSAELHGVMDKVDVYTSTLGKALGGGLGGFTTGRAEIIEMLRQRSRPYLFSNSLPPPIVAASLKVFDLLDGAAGLRQRLADNTARFRAGMSAAGFTLKPGSHPITPVMLGDAKLAQDFAARLLDHGIYVIGFFYPVVPKGQARIRVQISAAHDTAHIDQAIAAFTAVGRELGVVG